MCDDRIKCIGCERMILPSTAERNGGRCGQCARISEADYRKGLAYGARIAAGLAPTPEELQSAMTSEQLFPGIVRWELEPDYYSSFPNAPVEGVVERLVAGHERCAFLVSGSGPRLNLYLNDQFGVVEYSGENEEGSRYAWSEDNLATQIPAEAHIAQACPCCGVGLLWFHSQSHMRRDAAVALIRNLTGPNSRMTVETVKWIELGDMDRVGRGNG